MKLDSGPLVGTLRSENESAVKFGVIAQSWTSGILGGRRAQRRGDQPDCQCPEHQQQSELHEPPPPMLTGSPRAAGPPLPA